MSFSIQPLQVLEISIRSWNDGSFSINSRQDELFYVIKLAMRHKSAASINSTSWSQKNTTHNKIFLKRWGQVEYYSSNFKQPTL